jgi:hypothetical protein
MGPLLFFDRQRSSDVGDGRFSEGGGCERPGSIVTAARMVPFRRLSPACGGISGERRHLEILRMKNIKVTRAWGTSHTHERSICV